MLIEGSSLIWASDGMIRARRSLSDQRALSERVEDAVAEQIDFCDPRRTLQADWAYFDLLKDLTETVTRVMNQEARQEFDDRDRAFITQSVRRILQPGPGAASPDSAPDSEASLPLRASLFRCGGSERAKRPDVACHLQRTATTDEDRGSPCVP